MSKKLVRELLKELVDHQSMANLGGIVGGDEAEKYAQEDLDRYAKGLAWYDKNVMKKKLP